MKDLFAFALFAHGFAHLLGFAGPWGLARVQPASYRSALLDERLHVTGATHRAVGVAWLLLALGFFALAASVALGRVWWPGPTLGLGFASLTMCLLGWPSSWIGVVVNLGLITTLLLRGAVL